MKNDKSFQVFIITFSVLLHCCLGLILALAPAPQKPRNAQPIEVTYKSSSHPKQQIVHIPDSPEKQKLKQLKKQVDFLSDKAQRVTKQSVARKNAQENINRKQQAQRKKQKLEKIKSRQAQSKKAYKVSPFMQEMPSMPSTNSNYIPNVEYADMTALNTDQVQYYAYYSRLSQRLRPSWVMQINKFTRRASSGYLKKLGRKDLSTVLEVILDKKGYLKDILLLESSGNPYADSFAVDAFKNTTPFLNPPKDLVQADGLVHIFYGFHIRFNPRLFVRKKHH